MSLPGVTVKNLKDKTGAHTYPATASSEYLFDGNLLRGYCSDSHFYDGLIMLTATKSRPCLLDESAPA